MAKGKNIFLTYGGRPSCTTPPPAATSAPNRALSHIAVIGMVGLGGKIHFWPLSRSFGSLTGLTNTRPWGGALAN